VANYKKANWTLLTSVAGKVEAAQGIGSACGRILGIHSLARRLNSGGLYCKRTQIQSSEKTRFQTLNFEKVAEK